MQFVDEAAELTCPNCAVPLWATMLAGVRLHACKQCHGMLVQMGEFEALIDADADVKHPDTRFPCGDAADLNREAELARSATGDGHAFLFTAAAMP